MIDVHSPAEALTIHLPADLVAELRRLAQEKDLSVDELVREACLAYTEPYIWDRCYKNGGVPIQTSPCNDGRLGLL